MSLQRAACPCCFSKLNTATAEVAHATAGLRSQVGAEEPEAWKGVSWDVAGWLAPVVAKPIAAALLKPLGAHDAVAPATALEFMRALGDGENGGRKAIRSLLGTVELDALADAIGTAIGKLAANPSAHALSNKMAESTFTLSFAGLDAFFGGLEHRLGTPDPNLLRAMRFEHCDRPDANEKFTTSNYSITTTSHVEWLYVVAPGDTEQLARAGQHLTEFMGDLVAFPNEERDSVRAEDCRARMPMPVESLLPEMERLNERLAALKHRTLRFEELVSGRLYTGPLFQKYNGVLRGISDESPPFMRSDYERLCCGNKYETTLQVLNSAIIKLSKLTVPTTLYRGLSRGVLPDEFWKPNEFGVCGGIELGFMSATTDREVAAHYATGAGYGLVLELEQGMVDRGADLSWLSQYPHEREVCFAPLAGIEMKSSRVEGGLVIVSLSLSINLTVRTIEEVLAKRKKVVEDMCDRMLESFSLYLLAPEWGGLASLAAAADVKALATVQLNDELDKVRGLPTEHFNENAPLSTSIQSVIDAREAVEWPRAVTNVLAAANRGWADARQWLLEATDLVLDKRKVGDAELSGLSLLLTYSEGRLAKCTKLTMANNVVTDMGVRALARAVASGALPHCEQLDLGHNRFGDKGFCTLAEAWRLNPATATPALRHLSIAGNQVTDLGFAALADALAAGAMRHVAILRLGQNAFENAGLIRLSAAVKDHGALSELVELKMFRNRVSDDGLEALAGACAALLKLERLELQRNLIGDRGLGALVHACAGTPRALASVEILNLFDNKCGDKGALSLAGALREGALPKLKKLLLGENKIVTDAAKMTLDEACKERSITMEWT